MCCVLCINLCYGAESNKPTMTGGGGVILTCGSSLLPDSDLSSPPSLPHPHSLPPSLLPFPPSLPPSPFLSPTLHIIPPHKAICRCLYTYNQFSFLPNSLTTDSISLPFSLPFWVCPS